jgi:hypothetical protein
MRTREAQEMGSRFGEIAKRPATDLGVECEPTVANDSAQPHPDNVRRS